MPTDSKGLYCPKCECRDLLDEPGWEVVNTLKLAGRIRRYRICRNCGHRVRTTEKIDKTTDFDSKRR